MSVTSAIPYINFDGNASEAIEFYVSVLGADVRERLMFDDMNEHPFGDAANGRVMHSSLKIGDAHIMIGDVPPGFPYTPGGNVSVNLGWDELAPMAEAFAALGDGGKVSMDLHDAFWGATFGMLTDRFGVQWMFNGPAKKPE
jgi:PhnB protein